jgi:uncharacterized protein YoxC
LKKIQVPKERIKTSKELIEVRSAVSGLESDIKDLRTRTDDLTRAVEEYKELERVIEESKAALYFSLVDRVKASRVKFYDHYEVAIKKEIETLTGSKDSVAGSKK